MSDQKLQQRRTGKAGKPEKIEKIEKEQVNHARNMDEADVMIQDATTKKKQSPPKRIYILQLIILSVAVLALVGAGYGVKILYDLQYPPTIHIEKTSNPLKPAQKTFRVIDPSSLPAYADEQISIGSTNNDKYKTTENSDKEVKNDPESTYNVQSSILDYSVATLSDGLYNSTCTKPERVLYEGCSTFRGDECARVVIDDFLSPEEADSLLIFAETAFATNPAIPTLRKTLRTPQEDLLAGDNLVDDMTVLQPKVSVSIFDLFSGGVDSGKKVIDVYETMKSLPVERRFHTADIGTYKETADRFLDVVEILFGLDEMKITKPVFFSRVTSSLTLDADSKDGNDLIDSLYNHHLDLSQYPQFEHMMIIFLNSKYESFNGGNLQFINQKQQTIQQVEAIAGRAVLFTNSKDTIQTVANVLRNDDNTKGTQYILVLGTTCEPNQRLNYPTPQRLLHSSGVM